MVTMQQAAGNCKFNMIIVRKTYMVKKLLLIALAAKE